MRRSLTALGAATAALVLAPGALSAGQGRIVFGSNRADSVRELYVVNEDGTGESRLTFNDVFERAPAWSPDGSRIAFAGEEDGNWDIYTVDASGSNLRRLTSNAERDDHPRWTADGRIVFQRGPLSCPCEGWIVNVDGSAAQRLPIQGNVLTPDPSQHGQRLVYSTDRDGAWSLNVVQLNGRGDQRITSGPTPIQDFNARWSPNGSDIVFLRDRTGVDNDVYVVHSDGTGLRQLTDTPSRVEFWPAWSRDGSQILFQIGPGPQRLHAITLADGSESAVSTWPRAPIADDFEDGVRDASLWHQIVDEGGALAEQDGRLVISIAPGSTPGGQYNQVNAHYGSNCSLPGDYDFQVDWQLVQWAPIGFYASLDAFFANAGVSRSASPWGQQYVGWSDGNGAGIPTADTGGSFRIVRSGGTVFDYVRPAGATGWTLVFGGAAVLGDAVYGMGLSAPGDWYTGLGATVAFDNFRLNSGDLVCPGWWDDLFPDVY